MCFIRTRRVRVLTLRSNFSFGEKSLPGCRAQPCSRWDGSASPSPSAERWPSCRGPKIKRSGFDAKCFQACSPTLTWCLVLGVWSARTRVGEKLNSSSVSRCFPRHRRHLCLASALLHYTCSAASRACALPMRVGGAAQGRDSARAKRVSARTFKQEKNK